MLRRPPALKLHHQNPFPPRAFRQLRKWPLSEGLGKAFFAPVKRLNGCDADRAVEVQRGGNVSLFPQFLPVPLVQSTTSRIFPEGKKMRLWAHFGWRRLGPPSLYGAHTGPFSAGTCATGMADGRRSTPKWHLTAAACWLGRRPKSNGRMGVPSGLEPFASIEQ